MQGLMQKHELLISSLIEFAEKQHGDNEIVSRRVEGDIHRTNYREIAKRSRQVANGLDNMNLLHGDRIATIAWNGYRHMELYFGVSGSGKVLHTINPRLHPEQIAWIVNHAEDKVVCFDMTFLPLIKGIKAYCPNVKYWIAMCDEAALPKDTGIEMLRSYEEWIEHYPSTYEWPSFDENTASSMCYTSGTTGNPKAVLYSHRSTYLHALTTALPDALNINSNDAVLPVVPMFHVNAWGLPYSAAIVGYKLVFPGPAMDGKSIYDLIEAEKVTLAAGVPTVWQMLLNHLQTNNLKFSTLTRTVVGGAACPPAMLQAFQEVYKVEVLHAWGMTELSPTGTICTLKPKHLDMPVQEQYKVRLKQGRSVLGVDMKIVDATGASLPHDGKSAGDLLVRGPWVIQTYYKNEGAAPLVNGWFPTGDVATIDSDGYMNITDRSKDVIKSGGEWISSIDIENVAMAHPSVAMAACIGMKHPKWDERPIVVVVKKPGMEVSREELIAFFDGKIAKWQTPDDVVFVDAIPLGATGKMQKVKIRENLKDYKLPGL